MLLVLRHHVVRFVHVERSLAAPGQIQTVPDVHVVRVLVHNGQQIAVGRVTGHRSPAAVQCVGTDGQKCLFDGSSGGGGSGRIGQAIDASGDFAQEIGLQQMESVGDGGEDVNAISDTREPRSSYT